MTVKNKIIIIIICVLAEITIISGSYCIGRFTRYKGTTQIGEAAEQTVTELGDDVTEATTKVDTSINLLGPVNQANEVMNETLATLQKSKDATMVCLNNFVNLIGDSEKNIENFKESYEGSKKSDEYNWDLMIKEAEEYEILLKEYTALKEGN